MEGLHQCPGNMLFDICDGSICTNNSVLRNNQCALQIIGYYDELILTNPLMSRAKKYKIGNCKCIITHSYYCI